MMPLAQANFFSTHMKDILRLIKLIFWVSGGAAVYRIAGIYRRGIVPLLASLHAEGAYQLYDHFTGKLLAGRFTPQPPNL